MSLLGKDYFDKTFFEDQAVYIADIPLSKLKYGIYLSKEDTEGYSNTAVMDINYFTEDLFAYNLSKEDKIRHHFRKILWLIQNYCEKGWTNSIKAVNLLDNGTYHVHPGANRCVAASFLGCKELKTMITVHKDQLAWEDLRKGSKLISTEEDLRAEMSSTDTVLFRTEVEKPVFIDKMRTEKVMSDFTYEFVGDDAWPEPMLFEQWNELIYNSLPLPVINPKRQKISTSLEGKKFYLHDSTGFRMIRTKDVTEEPKENLSLTMHKPCNPFTLLYFVNPKYSKIQTQDEKLIIQNHNVKEEKVLTIPDHYVQ